MRILLGFEKIIIFIDTIGLFHSLHVSSQIKSILLLQLQSNPFHRLFPNLSTVPSDSNVTKTLFDLDLTITAYFIVQSPLRKANRSSLNLKFKMGEISASFSSLEGYILYSINYYFVFKVLTSKFKP
jgi:hypothetical protein